MKTLENKILFLCPITDEIQKDYENCKKCEDKKICSNYKNERLYQQTMEK